jgi:hypothetical protein
MWTRANQENISSLLQQCPPLQTIISRKAKSFINGKPEVLNFNTDRYVRGRHKAWEKLLRKPNPLQTGRQYRSMLYSYVEAYGFCPVMSIKPVGYEQQPDAWQLWILPPPFLKIVTNSRYLKTKNRMDSVESIEMKYDGETTVIDKSSVYIFTSMDMYLSNLTLPDSKLVSLKYPIGNIIKNYESRGTIAEEYGALGILSDNSANNLSSVSMTEAQKQELHDQWMKYGILKGQRKLYITTASVTYQRMGMSIAEMQLLEMLDSDVTAIADAFSYPAVLLANGKGTTYSNQQNAERGFIQNTTVPEAEHFSEQENEMLKTESFGVKICYDYDWLPIVQMDAKLRAQVRREMGLAVIYEFMNGVITWNEMKLALGQDTKDGMDLYVYQLPEEYRKIFEQSIENGKQSNPANGQGYQGDTNGENAGVEGATNANT